MTCHCCSFCRLSASALLTAALLILLSFTEADLARFAGPVPFATVTLSGDGGKWVVINRKGERQGTGAFVYAGGFSEGLAAVSDGLGWGYVDNKGVLVIPCKFSRAGEFHDGFAPVKVGGRSLTGGEARWDTCGGGAGASEELRGGWRFILKSGEFAFADVFEYAWEFSNEKAIVAREGHAYSILPDGTYLDDINHHSSYYQEPLEKETIPYPMYDDSRLYGYKLDDKWIAEPQFQVAERFSDGMAAVQENGKWGFIDLTGRVCIETDYDYVHPFQEGIGAVDTGHGWLFVRRDGKPLNDALYDDVGDFRKGLAGVETAGKHGILAANGKLVVPCVYDALHFDRDRQIAWAKVENKFGIIRTDGAELCEPVFDHFEYFVGSYAPVERDGAWNVVDISLRAQYEIFLDSIDAEDDHAIVSAGSKLGYFNFQTGARSEVVYDAIAPLWNGVLSISRDGRKRLMTIADCKEIGPEFDEIRKPVEGMAAFEVKGLWGFADSRWNVAVAPTHIEVRDFSNGLAGIRSVTGWGYIDTTGRTVVEPRYVDVTSCGGEAAMVKLEVGAQMRLADAFGRLFGEVFEQIGPFSEGLASAKSNGKWGYIDVRGRICIPMQFGAAGLFSSGLAPVRNSTKWGYLDKEGAIIVPFQYDSAESFCEDLGLVTKDGKWYFVDKTGSVALGPYDFPVLGFEDGNAWVSDEKQVWVPIDRKGVRDESRAVRNFKISDMARLRATGYLQSSGSGFDPEIGLRRLDSPAEGLRAFTVDTSWIMGIRDIEGKIVCQPEYEYIQSLCCGFAFAERNGQHLFLRADGTVAFDAPTGCKFDWSFKDGYATVTSEQGRNFIDREGNLLSSEWFQDVGWFSEGLAPVKLDECWGYIDGSGSIAIAPQFEDSGSFSAGTAIVALPEGWTVIDRQGSPLFPPMPLRIRTYLGEYVLAYDDNHYWFIDRKGAKLHLRLTGLDEPSEPTSIDVGDGMDVCHSIAYSDRIVAINLLAQSWFLVIDLATGRMRKVDSCVEGGLLPDGRIVVKKSQEDNSWGALDGNLEWVIPPEFDRIDEFSQGLAFARKGDSSGYIAPDGKWVIDLKGATGGPFRHGVALVGGGEGDRMWINRKGQKAKLSDADCEDARYETFEGGRAGFFDLKGNIVIYPWYDDVRSFSGGLAAVRDLEYRWGFIDKSGAYVIQPKFTETGDFSEGLAAVLVGDKQNGLWTFVDRKGNQIHEPYFDEVRPFHQGLAAVRRGALWGYMDKHGQMVFQLQFDAAGDFAIGEGK
ncbi:MAG: WG repeat-containing protein [Candidatus Brocadiia bacterium]